MSTKDFEDVFAEGDQTEKPENPAVALRAQRQERETEARNQFLAAFDQDPVDHQDEPAQAAVAAAAQAAADTGAGQSAEDKAKAAAEAEKAVKAKEKDKK